jgi:peptidoglycan/LPS O-acetylase OafA/YrhL
VEIDPKVRWEIHDEQVRARKRSARRWFLTGLALFVVGGLLGSALASMGAWPWSEWVAVMPLVGLVGMIVGVVKTTRTGRMSSDVIREVSVVR